MVRVNSFSPDLGYPARLATFMVAHQLDAFGVVERIGHLGNQVALGCLAGGGNFSQAFDQVPDNRTWRGQS